jgi:two-component system cell cycle response regulator DivK
MHLEERLSMLQVLIVEDTPLNMELVVTILRQAGHVPHTADTAAQGLALAQTQRPDVILMDVQLPDMDGLAATRLLKANPATCGIPVIALTAFAMKGDEERSIAAGCDGYVTKPVRYKELLATLEAVVARNH